MISIRGHGRSYKKRTSKGLLGSSAPPESSHNKVPINSLAIDFSKIFIAKYTEENLHRIFRIVLLAQAPSSNGPREKSLKARLFDVYCDKSHIEYYNFCQLYDD